MNSVAGNRIKVGRKGRNQCFPFSGFHFSYFSGMQNHAANQLNVKMSPTENTFARLTTDSKSFWE